AEKSYEAQALAGLIDQLLMQQAAEAAGLAMEPARVEAQVKRLQGNDAKRFADWLAANSLTLDDLRDQVRHDLLAAALRDQVTSKLPREQAHVHVRHILVGDEGLARQVHQRLGQGENFITLARAHSEDRGTRASGGDLGFLPRGIMSPEFDAAAFALQPGQFSVVLPLAGGYQIIQVVEVDPARPVGGEHWPLVQQGAFEGWLADLRAQADITLALP
ncbi:MAG: peptidylprolyl isomerase, partial [Chloroflexota bacterium]